MKILKIVLIVIVAIVAIPLIAALFIKKDYSLEREITINKPKQEVFDYIKLVKNQEHFSVWAMMDSTMVTTYTGVDGTVGSYSSWNGKMMGKGEQEIKKIDEGNRIDFELRFKEPFEATEPAYMITETVSDTETKVKWGFIGHMDYPMNIMLPLGMEKELSNSLQTGLDNLKKELEKQ